MSLVIHGIIAGHMTKANKIGMVGGYGQKLTSFSVHKRCRSVKPEFSLK